MTRILRGFELNLADGAMRSLRDKWSSGFNFYASKGPKKKF